MVRSAIEAIRKHKAAYLMAVGGAAYLVSKAIKRSRVVAFADLGMEAIYEFDVKDMPVTVAVDATGTSVHETGPREWQQRIGKIPLDGAELHAPARTLHSARRAPASSSAKPANRAHPS